jgi:hypothetical protein
MGRSVGAAAVRPPLSTRERRPLRLTEHEGTVLRRRLRGDALKVIAVDANVSLSTIATLQARWQATSFRVRPVRFWSFPRPLPFSSSRLPARSLARASPPAGLEAVEFTLGLKGRTALSSGSGRPSQPKASG